MQYVGLKIDVEPEEVEISLVKGLHSESDTTVTPTVSISRITIDPCKDELHFPEEHETLSELQTMYPVNRRDLVCYLIIHLDIFSIPFRMHN